MSKAKLSTKSNTVAPPKHVSVLREAVDRVESTKNNVCEGRKSLHEHLRNVQQLEVKLREARRLMAECQGSLSFWEDKLDREVNELQTLGYECKGVSGNLGCNAGPQRDLCCEAKSTRY